MDQHFNKVYPEYVPDLQTSGIESSSVFEVNVTVDRSPVPTGAVVEWRVPEGVALVASDGSAESWQQEQPGQDRPHPIRGHPLFLPAH